MMNDKAINDKAINDKAGRILLGVYDLILSAVMGLVLLLSSISMGLILGEWYLANMEFLMIGCIQLLLCRKGISGKLRDKKFLLGVKLHE